MSEFNLYNGGILVSTVSGSPEDVNAMIVRKKMEGVNVTHVWELVYMGFELLGKRYSPFTGKEEPRDYQGSSRWVLVKRVGL